jgi:cell wall-associated NlpC family hydrolase
MHDASNAARGPLAAPGRVLLGGGGTTPAQVVAEARSWIGTPFVHQAARKGVGTDCAGLVRGVFLALGLLPPDYERLLPPGLMAYARRPDGTTMQATCDQQLQRTASPAPGCVALIRFANRPHHLAFYGGHWAGGLSLIHALGPRNPARVVEHRLDGAWSGRIICAYSIPGVLP